MKKKDLIFIVVMVAVVGLFVLLSAIGRKPPALTTRVEHVGLNDKTAREACLGCHAPDSTVAPMPVRHPKKGRPPDQMNCLVCHQLPKAVVAQMLFKEPLPNESGER